MFPDRFARRVTRFRRFAGKLLLAAGGSAYLFTVGWRHPRNRALISTISAHFGYRPAGSDRIPLVELKELVSDNDALRLCEPEVADGNVSLLELLVISRLVSAFRPTRLFEIGTFDGRTTLNLAANSPESAVVFTLDLPREAIGQTALPLETAERVFVDKPDSGTRFLSSPFRHKVTQLYGDSAHFDFTPFLGSVDFVFVDGSHAYEYVMNDSETALSLLRPTGGVVMWHDYGIWEGVTNGLDRLHATDPRYSALSRISGTSLVLLDTRSDVTAEDDTGPRVPQ